MKTTYVVIIHANSCGVATFPLYLNKVY